MIRSDCGCEMVLLREVRGGGWEKSRVIIRHLHIIGMSIIFCALVLILVFNAYRWLLGSHDNQILANSILISSAIFGWVLSVVFLLFHTKFQKREDDKSKS